MGKFFLTIIRNKYVSGFVLRILRMNIFRQHVVKKYLSKNTERKLQIGSGRNPLVGWLNTGISLRESKDGIYMDAGKPFPLPDNSFDYVYSEHLIEHLTYLQALNMLEESYRVLKPSGVVRIATPDLCFLLRLYQEPNKLVHEKYIEYSAEQGGMPPSAVFVINRFHTTWGHQIVYDKDTLCKMLVDVGFRDFKWCDVGESHHGALKGIEGHHRLFTEEFNRLETMIVEATK